MALYQLVNCFIILQGMINQEQRDFPAVWNLRENIFDRSRDYCVGLRIANDYFGFYKHLTM